MPHSRSVSLCREATRSARGGERETNRGPGSRVCDGCPLGNGGYGHGCADRLARRVFAAGRRTATDPARGQDTGGSPRRPAFRRPGVRPVQGAQAPAPERACQAFLVYLTRKVLTTQQRHQAEERLRKRGRRPGNAVPGGGVLTSGDGTASLVPRARTRRGPGTAGLPRGTLPPERAGQLPPATARTPHPHAAARAGLSRMTATSTGFRFRSSFPFLGSSVLRPFGRRATARDAPHGQAVADAFPAVDRLAAPRYLLRGPATGLPASGPA
jgi:hypothetical protein